MKITILGVEVDEEKVKSLIETTTPINNEFNGNLFKAQLTKLGNELNKPATSDNVKEQNQMRRLYNGLCQLDKWFTLYNFSDKFPEDKIIHTTKLIQIKSGAIEKRLIDPKFAVKIDGSGLFSIMEVYIIPFALIDKKFPTAFEYFKYISLESGTQLDGTFSNPLKLPTDTLYGSSRDISKTHFAVIAGDQDNPLTRYVYRNTQWRYITASGAAV